MLYKYLNNNNDIIQIIKNSRNAANRGFWEWFLVPFIIGLITVSYIGELNKIMILYGLIVAGLFSIYFLYHKLRLQTEVIIYFVWVMWSLAGTIVAIDKASYYTQLMTIVQIGVLIFTIAGITSLRRDMSTAILAIWIGGVISFIYSFLTGEFQLSTQMVTRARAAGIVENANEFAINLIFVMVAVCYFWKRKPSVWWNIFLFINLAALGIGIVFTGSRGGIFGAIAFIFLWWFFCKAKKLPKHSVKAYFILLILISGIYYSTNYVMSSTFLGERIEKIDDGSTKTRIKLYEKGINIIRENPIFGVGLSNYSSLSGGLYSHSNYIEVAANTGIVGFMLYYSIYVVLWIRLNRIKRMTNDPDILNIIGILRAAFFMILLVSFSGVIYYSKLEWIFLASAIGYTWSIESILTKMKSYRENRPSAQALRRRFRYD